ncbi:hypothetical protein LG003_21215 [Photorhabdus kleinii]|uniref:hypothetical protein n=1 Tax=Photorhabdus kleinii TaxID=768034 RepID=UPI0021D50300|nr:hypothetical protein [Photorhabdus kleinii]MCT8345292.1 hypothetical protein [Photorhabdus kleinii]
MNLYLYKGKLHPIKDVYKKMGFEKISTLREQIRFKKIQPGKDISHLSTKKSCIHVGEVYGLLTVMAFSHIGLYGGKNTNFWQCQCNCGRIGIYPQPKLTQKNFKALCSVCLRGPCIVCGGPILDDRLNSNTCCEEHYLINRRNKNVLYKAKQFANDPDFHKKTYRKKREKIEKDPEYAALLKERETEKYQRRKEDPDFVKRNKELCRKRYAEKRDEILQRRQDRWELLSDEEKLLILEQRKTANADWYQKNKEYISERNKEKWNSLTDEEKEALRERKKEYDRKSKRKYIAELRLDPDKYREYLDGFKKYGVERLRREALNRLFRDSQELLGLKHESNN